jgi:hypothetical protein
VAGRVNLLDNDHGFTMRIFLTLAISLISLSCFSQEKAGASATQTIKINLLPPTIVERTSAVNGSISSPVLIQSHQQWIVKTKNLGAEEKIFFRPEEGDFMEGVETLKSTTAVILTLSPM